MTGAFQNVERVLKGASGVVAIVPGVALLARVAHLPHNIQTLMGLLAVTLGASAVLVIFLLRQQLKQLSAKVVALAVIPTSLLGAAATTFFVILAMTHVIVTGAADGEEDYILVPLQPSDELRKLVAPLQYDWVEALANSAISAQVRQMMNDEAGSTVWLLTGSLLLAQTLLLVALVVSACKIADSLHPTTTEPLQGKA